MHPVAERKLKEIKAARKAAWNRQTVLQAHWNCFAEGICPNCGSSDTYWSRLNWFRLFFGFYKEHDNFCYSCDYSLREGMFTVWETVR